MSMLCLRVPNTKVLHFRSWLPLNGSVRLNVSTKQISFFNPESELLALNSDLYAAAAKLCGVGRLQICCFLS